MKQLFLQDILRQIDGTVIKGSGNPIIKNVTYRPKKIRHHTLLFYRYKDMTIKNHLFREYESTVVVTDSPDYFKNLDKNVILVKVTNIEDAYWKFVRYYRNLFQIPVIGITGTCGKTTVKQMVKHILRKKLKVQSTFLSNNQKSLNLKYLLGIDEDTQAAVFEMPVASPGYMTSAIRYFQPQIRILLNIDVYHLKDCKTPEAYMKAKTEIVHELDSKSGIIILNADDDNIKRLLDVSRFEKVIFFGFSDGCHFQAKEVSYADGGMKFILNHQNKTYPVYVPGYGKQNVYNALAAIAAAWSAGLGIQESCERMASFNHVDEHLEIRPGVGGCTIIDDTWNVAPLSMASSLEVLQEVSDSKTKIALLGYMPQLGESEYAKQQYAKIGEKVVETKVDLLFVVNDEAQEIGRKALELGMNPSKVYFCDTEAKIHKILKPYLNKDSIILLKIPHRVMVQDSFRKLKQKIMA